MDFVVDANIIFAALIKKGITADLLCRETFHLYAPEFLLEEFEDYKELLKDKTERTEEEFLALLSIIKRRIIFVPKEEIMPLIETSKRFSPDPKDITYIALALMLNIPLWSNDKALKNKQNNVKVYNTQDLLFILKDTFLNN